MPDCRRPLAEPEEEGVPATVVVGEIAHIIGEENSAKSPRGLSLLPLEERNRYTNLILLCAHHHTVIDKNVAAWPVERLHVVKREHELWVEYKLDQTVDEHIQIYHDFINHVSIALDLERWEWVCDCLFRQIMHVDFPDGIYQLDFELFRALLPGKLPVFEEALKNLVHRARAYLDYYLSDAVAMPGDPRIMNRKRYKDAPHDAWEEKARLIEEYQVWQRNTTMLLFNLVVALNYFANTVRSHLLPSFFLRKGQFCVHDFMGLGSNFVETWHIPNTYFTDEQLAAPLKKEGEQE